MRWETRRGSSQLAAALIKWQQAAGVYWPYVNATPFLGDPPSAPLERANQRRAQRRSNLLRLALQAVDGESDVALFIDLPPAKTLPATARLNRSGLVVVPIIERWVAPVAVVPCDALVQDVVVFGNLAVHPSVTRGVVFLLDGDRAGPRGQLGSRSPQRLDNRYRYSIHRFPPPAFLLARRIGLVRWLSKDGIAPDLLPYVDRLRAHGLSVESTPARIS
jgi:hypothetical protein